MANVRNANTWYVDSTGDLAVLDVQVLRVVVTSTAATAELVLSDVDGDKKLAVRIAASDETRDLDFTAWPLRFPNGVTVTTITDCVATLVVREAGK